jgi:hypothetical protein
MKSYLLKKAQLLPNANILINLDERLGDKVKFSLNGLLSLNDSGIPFIASPEELLNYDIVGIEDIIEERLAEQKISLQNCDKEWLEEWLEEYVYNDHDVVEKTLKEFDISEQEVNLEELRDLQHELINYFTE